MTNPWFNEDQCSAAKAAAVEKTGTGRAEFMMHDVRRKGHFIEGDLASLEPRIQAPCIPPGKVVTDWRDRVNKRDPLW